MFCSLLTVNTMALKFVIQRLSIIYNEVFGILHNSYRDRYWRESAFKGIDLVCSALDEAYGAGKVSLVSAAFRWLNHHSQMKPEYNGEWEKGMRSFLIPQTTIQRKCTPHLTTCLTSYNGCASPSCLIRMLCKAIILCF